MQSQNVKLPVPIYAQLKALALARGDTMGEVIASFLQQAVEAGEIKPESAGLSVGIRLDLDADDEAGRGPWAVIKTNDGEMPYMSQTEAKFISDLILSDNPMGPLCFCVNRFGYWNVEGRGKSIKVSAANPSVDESFISVTMAPVVARALATQLRKLAPQLAAEAKH